MAATCPTVALQPGGAGEVNVGPELILLVAFEVCMYCMEAWESRRNRAPDENELPVVKQINPINRDQMERVRASFWSISDQPLINTQSGLQVSRGDGC